MKKNIGQKSEVRGLV